MDGSRWPLFVCLCLASALFAGGTSETNKTDPEKILVFNAAGATDLISGIGRLFDDTCGIEVETYPASSGTPARQIEQGADADLYISASEKWMNYVYDLGVVKATFLRSGGRYHTQ